MLFTSELITKIDHDFNEVTRYFGTKKDDIEKNIQGLQGDKKYCMEFLYANMPLSDAADYDFALFLAYVEHSLFVRESMPWGKTIPTDIFLSDVLFHRVSTEKLVDCRKILYDMVIDRITGKNMVDSVVEANYFSLEYATYRMTDRRTVSPLTLLKRSYGRCGEESIFTVSILRSLGIPARQVYTPLWAHCDSNHAWLEAYCDGTWHYLGACEPEPVLDKGWFDAAASRAMLLLSRTFYKDIEFIPLIRENSAVVSRNVTGLYAQTTTVTIKVVDHNKKPVADCQVNFEIMNGSRLATICTITSDVSGEASLLCGFGSFNIRVTKNGLFHEEMVNTLDCNVFEIDFSKAVKTKDSHRVIKTKAPSDGPIKQHNIDKATTEQHKAKFDTYQNLRTIREAEFDKVSIALAKTADPSYSQMEDILLKARGNAKELMDFVNKNGEVAYNMLTALNEQDYTDLEKSILETHLSASSRYIDKYEREIYVKYVLNPRVFHEQLTDYKGFISSYFSEERKAGFVNNPDKIWAYIQGNIKTISEKEFEAVYTSPVGVLTTLYGCHMSKNILFVAICRSLGIAARLNPANLDIEYYCGNDFITPIKQAQLTARLKIIADKNEHWQYFSNWSVSILENDQYVPLRLFCKPEEVKNIPFKAGQYRLISSTRLPSGDVFANEYSFYINSSEKKTIEMKMVPLELSNMLYNIKFNDFAIKNKPGESVQISACLEEKPNLLLYLEQNSEPTEHILNEMADNKGLFQNLDCNISFIMEDEIALSNRNISRVLSLLPEINVYFDSGFENREPLARKLYVDPEKLPLIVISKKDLTAVYATCGYNAGIAQVIINVLKYIKN